MARRERKALSRAERRELWTRWRSGESMASIARSLGRRPQVVNSCVYAAGGVVPWLPRRSARTLSLAEREEISRGLSSGLSLRSIARELGRPVSTVSREIRRNEGLVVTVQLEQTHVLGQEPNDPNAVSWRAAHAFADR